MPPSSGVNGRAATLAAKAHQPALLQILSALLCGAAQAASLALPWTPVAGAELFPGLRDGQAQWWLQLLAMAGLAWMIERSRSRAPPTWKWTALLGWVFATAWLVGSFGWTFIAMHTYGGLPAWMAALAVLLLAGTLALYYAIAYGLFAVFAPVNRALSAIVFASFWLLAELMRGTWFTGFGWGAVGYAHVDGPLSAYAPWLGMYGLSALAAWLAMTLAQAVRPGGGQAWLSRMAGLTAIAAVLMLPGAIGPLRADLSQPAASLSVTLLQGNIPQDEKFEAGTGVPMALQWYAAQLMQSRSSLVIAPETALPLLPQQLPENYWQTLGQRFASGEQAALLGMPLGNSRDGYTNSVVGLKPGQAEPWRYDKQHLVPFGEFIPPLFKWFTEMMNIPLGDFNRGAPVQPTFEWQGQRIAPNICYEDLFGEEFAPYFSDPARAPTIFINLSNLAWFGDSLAMNQHLQIARMRALEYARPFLLATNTGLSAIVNHRGEVLLTAAPHTRSVLAGQVEGRDGVTPYARWLARWGLWPYWLAALSFAMLALVRAHLRIRRSQA